MPEMRWRRCAYCGEEFGWRGAKPVESRYRGIRNDGHHVLACTRECRDRYDAHMVACGIVPRQVRDWMLCAHARRIVIGERAS